MKTITTNRHFSACSRHKTGKMRTAPKSATNTQRGLTETHPRLRRMRMAEQQSIEKWKPVVGYEGHYEVSDQGRVRSLKKKTPHVLKPGNNHKGYAQVDLCKDGHRWHRAVHLLVLEAFIGPRPDGMVACHYDDDPQNNHIDNLRWDTISANIQDCVRNGNHMASRRTHCPRGHKYTEENTYLADGGKSRVCRACAIARVAEKRAATRPEGRVNVRPKWKGPRCTGCGRFCSSDICDSCGSKACAVLGAVGSVEA